MRIIIDQEYLSREWVGKWYGGKMVFDPFVERHNETYVTVVEGLRDFIALCLVFDDFRD